MLIALFYLLLCSPTVFIWRWLMMGDDVWYFGRGVPAPRRPELIDSHLEINPTFNDWSGFA